MKKLMKEEENRLNHLIKDLEKSLSMAPEGTFYAVQNGKYTKWYHYLNGRNILIPKNDLQKAYMLASATFDRVRLKEACEERDAIKAYLRNIGSTDSKKYLVSHSELQKILNIRPSWSEKVRDWANASYQKSTREYHGSLYPTLKGDFVKSRAERDIANALFLAQIPYRYECAFSFDNGHTVFYPDFLIMNPYSGELYIWEHFGMEELGYYRHKNANKMYEYFNNGYIPGKNLICTVYSGDQNLTKAHIQKTIEYYFAFDQTN